MSTPTIFISYNSADRQWAEWIGWHLEEEGCSVTLQDWDFRPGANFVLKMQEAARTCDRTLIVLSDNFLSAEYTQNEWAAAFAQDPTGELGKLLPVRVAECSPDGLLGQIVWVDLVGSDEDRARTVLLDGLRERGKPDEPPVFPGISVPDDARTILIRPPHPGQILVSVPTIFISYAHENTDWLQTIRDTLAPLVHGGIASTWWDRGIAPGDKWRDEIDTALESAELAILLVSRHFLASEFIRQVELPYLIEAAKEGRVRLLWIPVGDALFEETELGDFQAVHDPGKPLNTLSEGHADQALAAIGRTIAGLVKGSKPLPQTVKTPSLHGLQRVSTARLPPTPLLLLGREDQLAQLTAAWEADHTHVLSVVAPGGVGKTALVNRWLGEMATKDYRGARRVYGWSFYSQGSGESKNASGEPFIDAALEWFGDLDPTKGSPWQRGERLAELIRTERTLLILDGLEPLQEPPRTGLPAGRLKDPGLQALLRNLAASNNGLCLITTREPVEDLDSRVGTTVERLDLRDLTPEAGAAVLRAYELEAPEEELRQISREFDGHALALTVLATYLRDVCDGEVRKWQEVPLLEEDPEPGGHAFRVMKSYEKWLGKGVELSVLYLLGLFDRPASKAEIDALLKEPAIPGLSDELVNAGEAGWKRAVKRLRDARLVADPGGPGEAGGLDAHPLVRTWFGERLKETNPTAYQAGHLRLYEHLRQAAPEYPDTLEEMQPLYHAVHHGCRAGRVQEALDEVYKARILRGNEHFSLHKLGAFGSDLAALSGFFERPWDRPSQSLSEPYQGFVLNEAGFDLRAQGRLAEAVAPMRASTDLDIEREAWKGASQSAGNLSELLLTLGRVEKAVEAAQESVDLADRIEDWQMFIVGRTALADALHQAGRVEEARELFEEAEAFQKERQPEYPLLYSLQGYQYCDLLLALATKSPLGPPFDQRGEAPSRSFLPEREGGGAPFLTKGELEGDLEQLRQRAEQTLDWMENVFTNMSLLSIALGYLTLGRTHLARAAGAPEPDPTHLAQATDQLDRAVDGLQEGGRQDYLPRAFLARAALYRVTEEPAAATRDLNEAFEIAERGGMRLFLTDAHLERARLRVSLGRIDEAREDLEEARTLVEETGYHRRDPEVAALAAALDG